MKKLILPLLLIALINSIIAQKPFRSNYQIQDPRVPTNGNFEEKIKKDPKLKLANSTVQPLNMTNNPSSNWLISYGLQQNYGNTGWADRYQAFYEYDEYHNRTNRLIQQWNGFEWENDDNRVYSYDENNNLITEIFQSWESDLMEIGTLSQDMQAWGLDGNGGLIGIGYNDSTGNNELRSVSLSTAEITTLTSFNFDSSSNWNSSMMVTDPDNGYVYANSDNLTLYRINMDGSAVIEIGTLSQHMEAWGLDGNGGLIGIGYNDSTGHNELRSVNVSTAEVTTLTSFDFDSGSNWHSSFMVTDPDSGYVYANSDNLTLYRINMDGSAVTEIGTLSQDMQAWGLDGNGGLIGIGYNNSTGNNELRSVNLSTAEVTTITDFNFDAWYWLNSIMVTDPDSGYVYAVSGSLRLYRFDMDEIIEWVWTNNTRNIYTYNEINNLITKINQYFDGTEWVNSGQDIYTYDESNNLITEIFQNYNTSDSTEWDNSSQTIYTYDESNNLITEIFQNYNTSDSTEWDNSSQTIYTYDESNNLITEIFQWWNNGWSNSSQTLYTYDENNNNTQLVWYYWNGSWNVWAFSGRIFYTWFDALLDIDIKSNVPKVYSLKQNYPNPFNPITTLRYELPENSHVIITIYDMLGRVVDTPVNQTQDAGFKSVIWKATNNNGNPVSAGIYLYQIQVGDYIETKKMVLLK